MFYVRNKEFRVSRPITINTVLKDNAIQLQQLHLIASFIREEKID